MYKLSGLTSTHAREKLIEFGFNILPEGPAASNWTLFISQFKSPLIYMLVIASGISFLLKDVADAVIILTAVGVNTTLGFYQERKAERGLMAIRKILTPKARVVRDKKQKEIEAKFLVPGDVVVITSGDRIPGDGVLVETSGLTINEAILTGESVAVVKTSSQLSADSLQQGEIISKNYELQTNNSSVFMGTTVVGGVGKFVVTATGLKTEIGKIAQTLKETVDEPTPLQKRFAYLAQILTLVVIAASVLIFISGIMRHESMVEMFATSVAIAVAAIPEGLVIALTAILALGMQRILKHKALVRKLVVAETLGTVTVIATDKTGTLTEGTVKVVKTDFIDHEKALKAATYANQLLDPLEVSLWEWLTSQTNFDPEELLTLHPKKSTFPFDADKKFSATFYDEEAYFMGAPEVLLSHAMLSQKEKYVWENKIETWAKMGLRILALGVSQVAVSKKQKTNTILGQGTLTFLGLVGFADPVRKSVKEALALCRDAGIAVKVITGDYRWTAEVVMREVGIHIPDPKRGILEGEELAHMSQEELNKRVEDVLLFARVTPNQKLRIVEALKINCEVVALVGDGVNDAPALKRADIGIVVGEASDVAKETADMILLDSNFATIVAAVEEGRGIFNNIKKVITYLLSDTFAEVILIFLGIITGVPLPLTAAQILWINLVTDTFPTLALTFEPKEKQLLRRKPISPELPLFSGRTFLFLTAISTISGVLVFFMYLIILGTTGNVHTARLLAFAAFSLKSLFYVFSLRERKKPIWRTNIFTNHWLIGGVGVSFLLLIAGLYVPVLQKLLSSRGLSSKEWMWVAGISVIVLVGIELLKIARNKMVKSVDIY